MPCDWFTPKYKRWLTRSHLGQVQDWCLADDSCKETEGQNFTKRAVYIGFLKIGMNLQTFKRNGRPVLWDKYPTTKRSAAGRMKRISQRRSKANKSLTPLMEMMMSRTFPEGDRLLENVKRTKAEVSV
jgi:hypothetical protein